MLVKKTKKALAIFLSACMVLGLIPSIALAEGDKIPETNAEQIVESGVVTPVSRVQDTNSEAYVEYSKIIEATGTENEFNITFSIVTSDDVNKLAVPPDAVVVLVLDESNSMLDDEKLVNVDGVDKTRFDVAIKAAKNFITDYAYIDPNTDSTVKKNVVRGLAIVGFRSTTIDRLAWTNVATDGGAEAIKALDYEIKNDRNGGTNLTAGLRYAYNLLTQPENKGGLPTAWENITNVHVVLLSDGGPTHSIAADFITASGHEASKTGDGKSSQSNSDKKGFADDALARATAIKGLAAGNSATEKVKVHTIGFATSTEYAYKEHNNKKVPALSCTSFLQSISSSGTVHDANNQKELIDAFKLISDKITVNAEAWTVTDPMGPHISFLHLLKNNEPVSLNEGQQVNAVTRNDEDGVTTLKWAVDNDTFKKQDNGTFLYEKKYTVRLRTEDAGFVPGQVYATNGTTELVYAFSTKDAVNQGVTTFTVPSVEGYKADFSFEKVDDTLAAITTEIFTFSLTDTCGHPQNNFTAATDEEGFVSFTGIPSGHTYSLTEAALNDKSEYQHNTTAYTVRVAYGKVYVDGKLYTGADSKNTFQFVNERKDKYTVTVNYYVNGKQITDATYVHPDKFRDGAEYNVVEKIVNPFVLNGKNYTYVTGTHSDMTYTLSYAAVQTSAVGKIQGENVVIDLYYQNQAEFPISLTKDLTKDSDMTYPEEFTFLFTLYYLDDDVKTPVATLELDQDDFRDGSATERFTWTVESIYEVLGKELYITEEVVTGSGWSAPSDLNDSLYATISADGTISMANNTAVVNTFTRAPEDEITVDLNKSFTGDWSTFIYQGEDGSNPCLIESHTHGDECYVLGCDFAEAEPHSHDEACAPACVLDHDHTACELVNCSLYHACDNDCEEGCELAHECTDACKVCAITAENHVHNEACEVQSCDLHQHDATCKALECLIPEGDHTHTDDCYSYTFAFTLSAADSEFRPVAEIGTLTVTLTAAEIKALGTGTIAKSFTIPGSYYRSGTPGTVTNFVIRETSENSYMGWTLANDITFSVNRFGDVITDPVQNGPFTATNVFGALEPDTLRISKTVADVRGLGAPDETYTFILSEVTGEVDRFTVKNNGFANISLSRYLAVEEAVLTLTEDASAATKGMAYDSAEYTITVKYGKITNILKNGAAYDVGESNKTVAFTNTYTMPVYPAIEIVKNTAGADGTFSFGLFKGAEEEPFETVSITTKDLTGKTTVNLADAKYEDLFCDFTGTITVKELGVEADDSTAEGYWRMDETVHAFTFAAGVLETEGDAKSATAIFNNQYITPEIGLVKTVSKAASILPNEVVTYTLTVTNTGGEALSNVIIYDEMLVNYSGQLKVALGTNGQSPAEFTALTPYTDEDQTGGYLFDAETGEITLLDSLAMNGQIIITYTMSFATDGIYPNEANVTAWGAESEIQVGAEGEQSVTVTTPYTPPVDPPVDPPFIPEIPEIPNVPVVTPPVEEVETITEPEIPLGEVTPPAEEELEVIPEEEIVIIEEEIPLGDLPNTGVYATAANYLWTLGALAIMFTLVILLRKGKEEEEA